jgi:hypothetical protein
LIDVKAFIPKYEFVELIIRLDRLPDSGEWFGPIFMEEPPFAAMVPWVWGLIF